MASVISERGGPSNPHFKRIKLVRGLITEQDTDAIVSVLPIDLDYSGAINTAILEAAGESLDHFVLDHIYKPVAGDIYAVPGFNLPCKHVLFSIMPRWRSDFDREDKHLLIACRRAMELARSMCLSSVSFPPLATGQGSYPPQKAARLIVQAILERFDDSFREIRIVCRSEKMFRVFEERLGMYN